MPSIAIRVPFGRLPRAQNDAAHCVPAATSRRGHDVLAILAPVEPLDLPNVRIHLGIL